MRENKFRAWDKRFKMFIYQLPNGYRLDLSGKFFVIDSAGKNFRESDEFELVQYTGLNDMEDNEIYEGDLLTLNYGIPPTLAHFKVVFENTGFYVKCWDAAPKSNPLIELKIQLSDVLVIGNIYENPELDGTKHEK